MFGVAPGPAEFEVNLHRHFERDCFAPKLCDLLCLFPSADRAIEGIVHLQQWDDPLSLARSHPKLGVARR